MRNETIFFYKDYYVKTSHNKFSNMGKNLKLLQNGLIPKGKSFVSNVTELINSKASLIEKGQYIYLAGMRNYMDILLYNSRCLELYKLPEVPVQELYKNRLLDIRDGKIYFYFEDF